jgi:anti-sigma factor RsiW
VDCKETRDLLSAHADRELGLRDAAEIDRHLNTCPACQGEFTRQNALRAVVRKHATRFAALPQLESRIQAGLTPESPPAPVNKWTWRWNWLNVGAAFASVFAVAWSLELYFALPSAQDQLIDQVISSHVRSLMVNHITDVASSDQHSVKPWFNGKLDFSPTVTDFTAQGFPLVGGRLDYLHGRTVAAVVYRHRQHLINEYTWPVGASEKREAAVQTLTRNGFNVARWAKNGMVYWVISDLNSHDLMMLVQMLRNADGVPAAAFDEERQRG